MAKKFNAKKLTAQQAQNIANQVCFEVADWMSGHYESREETIALEEVRAEIEETIAKVWEMVETAPEEYCKE